MRLWSGSELTNELQALFKLYVVELTYVFTHHLPLQSPYDSEIYICLWAEVAYCFEGPMTNEVVPRARNCSVSRRAGEA